MSFAESFAFVWGMVPGALGFAFALASITVSALLVLWVAFSLVPALWHVTGLWVRKLKKRTRCER